MENLLNETLAVLKSHKKTPADVRWVQTTDPNACGSWDDFAQLADFEYDFGYGGNEVARSLKIVGDDWWLERGEYDGSEWWEYMTKPIRCRRPVRLKAKHLRD